MKLLKSWIFTFVQKKCLKQKFFFSKQYYRKEFFKTDIDTIVRIVKENHGEVDYLVDVEAFQYRQSMEMSDEDEEYIAELYDDLEEEDAIADDN